MAEIQRRVEQVKADQARIRAEVEQMIAEVGIRFDVVFSVFTIHSAVASTRSEWPSCAP